MTGFSIRTCLVLLDAASVSYALNQSEWLVIAGTVATAAITVCPWAHDIAGRFFGNDDQAADPAV